MLTLHASHYTLHILITTHCLNTEKQKNIYNYFHGFKAQEVERVGL